MFFSTLVDLFYEVKTEKIFTESWIEHLQQLINEAPPLSRLKILYYQFMAECYVYVFDQHDRHVLETIVIAHEAGLSDTIWMKHCPLLRI